MILYNLSFITSCVGGYKHYEDMLNFVNEHGIECICEHYKFEDFPVAFEKLEHGTPIMRCVLDTESFSEKFKK